MIFSSRLTWLAVGVFFVVDVNVIGQEMWKMRALEDFAVRELAPVDDAEFWESVINVQNRICPYATCSSTARPDRPADWPSPPDTVLEELRGCCLPCSCADGCAEVGNCCLEKTLQPHNTGPNNLFGTFACVRTDIWAFIGRDVSTDIKKVRMVTKCPERTVNENIKDICENPDPYNQSQALPVTSLGTGITYWNVYCSTCHDDTDTVSWLPVLGIRNLIYHSWNDDIGFFVAPNNATQMLEVVLHGGPRRGTIYFAVPQLIQLAVEASVCHDSYDVISTCNTTGLWETFEPLINEACLAYNSLYDMRQEISGKMFRNVFCMMCNPLEVDWMLAASECELQINATKNILYSVTGLLDVSDGRALSDQRGGSTAGSPLTKCPCQQVWDPYKETCRPVLCPPLETWRDCQCEPFLQQIAGMDVIVHWKIAPLEPDQHPNVSLTTTAGLFADEIHKQVSAKVLSHVDHTSIKSALVFSTLQSDPNWFIFQMTVVVKDGFDTRDSLYPLLSLDPFIIQLGGFGYHASLTRDVRRATNEDLHVSPNYTLTPLNSVDSNFMRPLAQTFSELMYCPQVSLSPSEYSIENYTLIVMNQTKVGEYYLSGEDSISAYVCVQDFLAIQNSVIPTKNTSSLTIQIVKDFLWNILNVVSVCCLIVLTVNGFLLFRHSSRIADLFHATLLVHLLLYHTLLLVGRHLSAIKDMYLCTTIAVLTHFVSTAVVFWLQACCTYMYMYLGGRRNSGDASAGDNDGVVQMAKYLMTSLMTSAVCVSVLVALSVVGYGSLSAGYDMDSCFLSDAGLLGWFLVLPAGFVLLVNGFLFLRLRLQEQAQPASSYIPEEPGTHSLPTYIFLSALVCLSWVCAYCYMKFAMDVFDFLAVFLDLAQGLYLLLFLLWNPRGVVDNTDIQ